NLKMHLLSYYSLTGNECSSFLFDLLEQTRKIEWQPCGNEYETLVNEKNIRDTHNPVFNNKNPYARSSYYHLGYTFSPHLVHLQYGETSSHLFTSQGFGPFRGPIVSQRAFSSIVRLLWFSERHHKENQCPPQILKPLTPTQVSWP